MTWFKAELHCHTCLSDGFLKPQELINKAVKKGIRLISITDHNTASGGLSLGGNHSEEILIIPGEEITTDRGHLLAYFIQHSIAPGKFEDVINQVHAQNGLAFMAHPYHIPFGNRFRKKSMFNLTNSQLDLLDGIEIENGQNRSRANAMAAELAKTNKLKVVGGSDAHFPFEVGNVITEINSDHFDLESIKNAIKESNLRIQPRCFNGYVNYLLIGIFNKLKKQKYSY